MFLIPYLKCIFPVLFTGLFVLAYVFTRKLIQALIIHKPIPQNGFASVEDEIRYVNDEPAEQRRIWGYKATLIFIGAFILLAPLSYLIPAMVFK